MNYHEKSSAFATNNHCHILSDMSHEEFDDDFDYVRAGIDSVIEHADKLRIMKYEETMAADNK